MALSVDAYTLALYRFNETSVSSGYTTAVDSAAYGGTTRSLASSGETVSAGSRTVMHIVNGPTGVGYARWMPGQSPVKMTCAGDATALTTLLASHTFEFWIRFESLPSSGRADIICYAGDASSETAANNFISCLGIQSTGLLQWNSENNLGVNAVASQTGTAMSAGTWYHVGCSVDNSGATASVKFYINGTAQNTVTGLVKATGGSSASWTLGPALNLSSPNYIHAAIKDMRISNTLRSDGDIAASAALTTTYQHSNDANTFILWRFQEAPDAIEASTYGYHARKMVGSVEITDPLADDGGRSRHFDGTTEYNAHYNYSPFRTALAAGEWTFETWFRYDSGYTSTNRGFWAYGISGASAQTEDNFVSMMLKTDRKLNIFEEADLSGVDHDYDFTTSGAILSATQDGYNKHYLAVTQYDNGGTRTHEVYLDGVLLYTGTASGNFAGGTNSMLRLGVGDISSTTMTGLLDDMRWQSRRLTGSEIISNYTTGLDADPCACVPEPATTYQLPKLEGMITVPTGGWSISVTEVPAATSSVTVAAGNYWPTSTTSLVTALQTALNANSTLAGTYTISVDDDDDTATGKVTISATGLTSFSITWTSTALRDALGFTGTVSGANTHTSPSACPHIWLPNVKRWGSSIAPDGYQGQPVTDGTITISPSGVSKAIKWATRYVDIMEWRYVLGRKTWSSQEATTNESYETFYGVAHGRGQPVRYHADRSDDATYNSYRHLGINSMTAMASIPGFTGGASSLWNLGPNDVLKYVAS